MLKLNEWEQRISLVLPNWQYVGTTASDEEGHSHKIKFAFPPIMLTFIEENGYLVYTRVDEITKEQLIHYKIK